MNTFNLVGLGPGSKDYILPKAINIIKEADIIIGGMRNLENIRDFLSEKVVLKEINKNIMEIPKYIKDNFKDNKVVLVVSGDPGFFSMLNFTLKYFNRDNIIVTPGISSLQYMFAKIKLPWQNGNLISLHGREAKVLSSIKTNNPVGILTDKKYTPFEIRRKILLEIQEENNGLLEQILEKWVYIGSNLSYPNEKIIKVKLRDLKDDEYGICVLIIGDE